MPGVMDLIWPGPFAIQSIHIVARLGIADLLGGEPRTVDELAEAAQVHAPSLKRILRALTTLGVFFEDDDGCFRHTELSQTLRADHAASVRAWALLLGALCWTNFAAHRVLLIYFRPAWLSSIRC